MIGYYIHHEGFGHAARAMSISRELNCPVTALTSMDIPHPHPFAAVVKLPRDDDSESVADPTAQGALHWAPLYHNGFRSRMNMVSQWVADEKPVAMVADVSVEIAVFARLLGVPVVVMALPGERHDAPHAFVHRIADHIIAAWPQELYVPAWLHPYVDKTSFVGGISRFDGRRCVAPDESARAGRLGVKVLVFAGASGGFDVSMDDCAAACSGTVWTALGGTDGRWVDDPWPHICAADVIVTHAGQSAVADVAAAGRPAVVIPQRRPYEEQSATAMVLRRHGLAAVATDWPDGSAWPDLIAQAAAVDRQRWRHWQVSGAASRAARAIEITAHRRAMASAP